MNMLSGIAFLPDLKTGAATFTSRNKDSVVSFVTENGGESWTPVTFPAAATKIDSLTFADGRYQAVLGGADVGSYDKYLCTCDTMTGKWELARSYQDMIHTYS